MKKFLFLLFFAGCSVTETTEVVKNNEEKSVEIISEYDYKKILGYNAAIAQFYNPDSFPVVGLMPQDLSNKKVASYSSETDEENTGYEDGYHEAIDTLFEKNSCSRMPF
jgi:hypothetical protein